MKYRNILLIDDDDDDQEIFTIAVAQISPFTKCLAYSSAPDVLKKLVGRELKPDVIFLDLNMPVMNGEEFLTRIKKEVTLSSIPVIIFSTSADARTKQLMLDLGALDFIMKPAGFDSLVHLLQPLVV